MPHIQYFDRSGRALSRREAFEADGKTIRDGVRCRVPHQLADHAMRDAAPRFAWDAHRAILTDGRSGGLEGNRPGFRKFTADDTGRQAIIDAYADYDRDREAAWRTPPPDAGFGSLDAKKKEDPPVTGRTRCRECGGRGIVHGRYCQHCGGDGWVDDNGGNGKRPQLDPASDRRSVDQMARDHSVAMEQVYAARNREISEAWREGKATNG